MIPHLVFPLQDMSRVGEARRAASDLARQVEFDETAIGRLSLVVTELGTNLVRHAREGQLLIGCRQGANGHAVEVLSLDKGPGMANVQACLKDGYSTSGTPGNGLGAVQRLADEFEVFSEVGNGTVIAARVHQHAAPSVGEKKAANAFSFAAVCTAAPGETICGDGWAVVQQDSQAAVMVADGLGHGPAAAVASDEAIRVLEKNAFLPPSEVLNRAHVALRSTRGAAMAVAQLDAETGSVVFSGAGNVVGRIASAVEDRSLLSQHGTVGLQVRKPQDIRYPWPEHAVLVLHSDGLMTRWSFKEAPGLLQCHPVVIAAWLIRGYSRGKDDATVVVVRRG